MKHSSPLQHMNIILYGYTKTRSVYGFKVQVTELMTRFYSRLFERLRILLRHFGSIYPHDVGRFTPVLGHS